MAYRDLAVSIVNMAPERLQLEMFQMFAKHDGDKDAIMRDLEMSRSTLFRTYNNADFHDILVRCGWKRDTAARRGKKVGNAAAEMAVLSYLEQKPVRMQEFGDLAKFVWGRDEAAARDRLFGILENLVQREAVRFDVKKGLWSKA